MLDIKRIRKNPEELVAAMKARRNKGADVSGILELDEKRREVIQRRNSSRRNAMKIPQRFPCLKSRDRMFPRCLRK